MVVENTRKIKLLLIRHVPLCFGDVVHIDCCYNIYELGVEGVVYVKGVDIGG